MIKPLILVDQLSFVASDIYGKNTKTTLVRTIHMQMLKIHTNTESITPIQKHMTKPLILVDQLNVEASDI